MKLFAGTSGYQYKQWKGRFYPSALSEKDMLSFYAGTFSAVEINYTFHRMPNRSTLLSWAERTPPGFRFVLKAPRKITHSKPLMNRSEDVSRFLETAAVLEDKLGGILFQFPPYLNRNVERLSGFTDLLPPETRAAFEFRHASWFDKDVYGILREKNLALCCSDTENPDLVRFVPTADWGYLRLRMPDYTETKLLEWARKISSPDWHTVFAFFKHEEEATGPKLAKRFSEMAASFPERR